MSNLTLESTKEDAQFGAEYETIDLVCVSDIPEKNGESFTKGERYSLSIEQIDFSRNGIAKLIWLTDDTGNQVKVASRYFEQA